MRIFTNTASLSAQNNLLKSQKSLGSAIERLSSGARINAAADDAAGLAIANRMDSQIRGKNQAQRNAQDAYALLSTLDGGLETINEHVQRIRELGVQYENGTNTPQDLASIEAEIRQRIAEIDRLSESLSFNNQLLMADTAPMTFQIGAGDNATGTDALDFSLRQIDSFALGLQAGRPSISDAKGAANPLVLNSPASGDMNGVFDKFHFIVKTGGKKSVSGIDAVAAYFGVSAGDISVHAVLDSAGNEMTQGNGTDLGGIAVKVGNKYYWKPFSSKDFEVRDDGALSITLFFNGASHKATVIDQRDGTTTTDIRIDQSQLSVDENGNNVAYFEYNGWTNLRGNGTKTTFTVDANGNNISPNKANLMAVNFIDSSDVALHTLGSYRAVIGATMNRMESVINGLSSDTLALEAAKSRINDADYAVEVSNMTRAQILQQAGQAVLAQANQIPQTVLSLIK